MKNAARWALVLLWGGLVFCLSTRLGRLLGPWPRGIRSYLLHLLAYAVLTALLAWALRFNDASPVGNARPLVLAWTVALAVALLHEALQYFVPGRTSSLNDLVVDLIAITCTAATLGWWRRLQEKTGG